MTDNGGHVKKTTDHHPVGVTMSTLALESKLRILRDRSNTLSATLTQKLASSRSGQNLLHIGSSLSSLPPDLHLLLQELHPLLQTFEGMEDDLQSKLQHVSQQQEAIREQSCRIANAAECAEWYEDLVSAEQCVENENGKDDDEEEWEQEDNSHDTSLLLERAALTTACLVQELESLPSFVKKDDQAQRTQFLIKLSPRIRALEKSLLQKMISTLASVLQSTNHDQEDLLKIGHCMRGLALLGKGKEVESVFASVAIMPLVRSKVSMGRLDEGGARGECAGLFSLLDNMGCAISQKYGAVLRLAESMFVLGEVDLVTEGVWVPIATALQADPAIKMAIFSPGIASVLQANYSALDTFLSELAERLLQVDGDVTTQTSSLSNDKGTLENLYFSPSITPDTVKRAQERIYRHSMTAEFSKKWNLPIYYQLRFGESCTRLNKAVEKVQLEGWDALVFTGTDAEALRNDKGFELELFLELYDVLQSLWRPDVILRPLTHRFLRGAVQLIGRVISFVRDGLENKIQFGQVPPPPPPENENAGLNGDASSCGIIREPYCWGENLRDVAAVAWDLTVLETCMTHDYVDTVCDAVVEGATTPEERDEIRQLASQVLVEASEQLGPLVQSSWNEVIVSLLTGKCCGPLAAVKGVGATYRMTNRPPPTQASPFVAMILRPLQEFDTEFSSRTPPQVGTRWKEEVIVTVAQRYSVAVEELLVTVQRTEVALRNRKARRTASGGMSDGEKVKLQLFLDYKEFSRNVQDLGIDAGSVEGVKKLEILTRVENEGRSAPNSLNGNI